MDKWKKANVITITSFFLWSLLLNGWFPRLEISETLGNLIHNLNNGIVSAIWFLALYLAMKWYWNIHASKTLGTFELNWMLAGTGISALFMSVPVNLWHFGGAAVGIFVANYLYEKSHITF